MNYDICGAAAAATAGATVARASESLQYPPPAQYMQSSGEERETISGTETIVTVIAARILAFRPFPRRHP